MILTTKQDARRASQRLAELETEAFAIALEEATPLGVNTLAWERDFSEGERYRYLRRAILADASRKSTAKRLSEMG